MFYDDETETTTYDDRDVTQALELLQEAIPQLYSETRERQLALTKLDECGMWLERASTRDMARAYQARRA